MQVALGIGFVVAAFGVFAFILLSQTVAGETAFEDLFSSTWEMFTLMTTASYPGATRPC